MSEKQGLTIYYDSKDVDTELNKAIEEAIKRFGYKIWNSGYSLIKRKAHLAFTKED